MPSSLHAARSKILAASVLAIFTGSAQTQLTVDHIMQGFGLTGYTPSNVRWSGKNDKIFFNWKRHSDPLLAEMDTYAVNRDGTGMRKLSPAEARLAPPAEGAHNKSHTQSVHSADGDLYLYDFRTDSGRRLTSTVDAETAPQFTTDEKSVTFMRSGNLYRLELAPGFIEQLTDIRPAGADGPPEEQNKGNESQEYLKKEERALLDIIKQRAAKREEDIALGKRLNARKFVRLQVRESVSRLQLSPDGKYVIIALRETDAKSKRPLVPNFVTESAYTETAVARVNVGDDGEKTKIGVLSLETGDVKWVEHGLKASESKSGPKDAPRNVSMTLPVWSEDGTKNVLVASAADNKERWIMALDPSKATVQVLYSERDEAWVNPSESTTVGWLKDDSSIYFLSERDGYMHLYTLAWAGGQPKQLTSGKWEVQKAALSRDKSRFILETNEPNPADQHIWTMQAEGGRRTRLTSNAGSHTAFFSHDDRWIADVYSYTNKPPELYVMEARPGAMAAKLTDSPSPEFWKYPWTDAPIVQITARDGVRVPGRLYKPKGAVQGGPAVIFVHGAGYLQNIHRGWSSYFREYMFHHLLADRGYTVLDIDYRASSGYGRDWRTGIYRFMGGKDLEDHVDAARWLIKEQGVDPRRIGIYGGSYGGFITLMAMFQHGDLFAAGAALRPVTDWAHYNHGYTSNILNIPQEDAEAFKRSSPIYFADGLKGALLICHGMIDDNVHYQDSVRLVQRLIELRKENWEFASYPAEPHSFVQPTSWADEYKRILKLFETNLKAK